MEEVAGDDRVRRVRLGLDDGAPRLERVALVRPQPREAEVELHDRELRVQLRELLEPVERALRPGRERRADLRLERVVLREERSRSLGLAPLIQPRPLRQVPRLLVLPEAEREGERRSSFAEARLGRRRLRAGRVAVGGENRGPDDSDRRDRDGADEERDTTLRGHRRTIARAPTL